MLFHEAIARMTHSSSCANSNIEVFTKRDKITIHKFAPLIARGFFWLTEIATQCLKNFSNTASFFSDLTTHKTQDQVT